MSEAPKKIWVWDYAAHQMVNENPDSTDVAYIRADLVDGLVEALELSAFHMHKITTSRGKADYSVVRAALKALESAEIGRGME
jgi:hypothetical protein